MSLSHISNCGVGSCYLTDAEQLHVDGNKSLVYSMINYTLKPEDTTFRVPGSVAYVRSPKLLLERGQPTQPPPGAGLPPQAPILNAALDAGNDFTYEFTVDGLDQGVANGGVEGKVTVGNVGGVGQLGTTDLILERYRSGEEDPGPATGCGRRGRRVGGGQPLLQPGRHVSAGGSGSARQHAAAGPVPHLPDRRPRDEAARLRRLGRPRHHLHVASRRGRTPARSRTRSRT